VSDEYVFVFVFNSSFIVPRPSFIKMVVPKFIALGASFYRLTKKYDKAADLYEALLKKYPHQADLYPIIADTYLKVNKSGAKFIPVFEKALFLNPQNREIALLVANFYLRKGTGDDKALSVYENALKFEPTNIQLLRILATIYLKKKNHTKAIEMYERLLKLGQADAAVYKNLSKVYLQERRVDEKALEVYRKVLALEPGNRPLNLILGQTYLKNRRLDEEAILVYEKALEFAPSLNLREVLGQAYLQKGDIEKARDIAKQWVVNSSFIYTPESTGILSTYIEATLKMNAHSEIIPFLMRLLKIYPNDKFLLEQLSQVYQRMECVDKNALDIYQRALKTQPTDLNLHKILAKAYLQNEEINECMNELKIILQLDPNSVEEVLEGYKKVVDKFPGNLVAHREMANLYLRRKTIAEALNSFRKCVSLNLELIDEVIRELQNFLVAHPDENVSEINLELGDLYLKKGHFVNALSYFKKVVEQSPDHAERIITALEATLKERPESVEFVNTHAFLTNLYFQKQAYRQARDHIEIVFKYAPTIPGVTQWLITIYERFLNENKNDQEARFRLAGLYQKLGKLEEAIKYLQITSREPGLAQASKKLLEQCLEERALGYTPVLLTVEFFKQSGFEVTRELKEELSISSNHPRYAKFGNILVQILVTKPLYSSDIRNVFNNAQKKYQGKVEGKIAFVIVSTPPESGVYHQIYTYKSENAFTIIPLSDVLLKKSIIDSVCAQELEKNISLFTGQGDLYSNNSPIVDPLNFFGRERIIDELLDYINNLQHVGLFGMRKIGKTSLIWQLKERLSKHLVAYVDLQEVPKDCNYLYKKLIEELTRDFKFKFPHDTLPELELMPYNPRGDAKMDFSSDLLTLNDYLQEKYGSTKIVLLLDEIEQLIPGSLEEDGFRSFNEFLGAIRGISQRYRFLVSIVVGVNPRITRTDRWGTKDNPMFQFYKEVFLPFFNEKDCSRMITRIGEQLGLTYTTESQTRIYEETGGHPFITRQLCSLILGKVSHRPCQIQVDQVEEAASYYLENRTDYLESIWQRLSRIEQDLVVKIVKQGPCLPEQVIPEKLPADRKKVLRKGVLNLTENSLIKKSDGKYVISADLFKEWVLIQSKEH
jgi:tetratricopeptide (TPR) repeat protein